MSFIPALDDDPRVTVVRLDQSCFVLLLCCCRCYKSEGFCHFHARIQLEMRASLISKLDGSQYDVSSKQTKIGHDNCDINVQVSVVYPQFYFVRPNLLKLCY